MPAWSQVPLLDLSQLPRGHLQSTQVRTESSSPLSTLFDYYFRSYLKTPSWLATVQHLRHNLAIISWAVLRIGKTMG